MRTSSCPLCLKEYPLLGIVYILRMISMNILYIYIAWYVHIASAAHGFIVHLFYSPVNPP